MIKGDKRVSPICHKCNQRRVLWGDRLVCQRCNNERTRKWKSRQRGDAGERLIDRVAWRTELSDEDVQRIVKSRIEHKTSIDLLAARWGKRHETISELLRMNGVDIEATRRRPRLENRQFIWREE